VKSSKDNRHAAETGDLTQPRPPRKFAPRPVEITTKSSKSRSSATEEKPKPRRFAPEPVETTTKSSRDRSQDQEQKPTVRKFAPQPVETSHTSSKQKKESEAPHIRFTTAPFSPPHSSNGASKRHADSGSEDVAPDQQSGARPVRRFAPMLLDTAQRSRKAHHSKHLALDDRTESGYHLAAREHRRHITGTKTPAGTRTPFEESDSDIDTDSNHHLDVTALEQSSKLRPMSPLNGGPRPVSRFSERSHSFRLPDLDTIESSESEQASQHSSLSSSPGQGSPITTSDSSWNEFKHATRIRESVDENFSHYLLQLEAKRAEERMREAALAAFPNSDFHEPVQHYVNEETDTDSVDSLEDRPATWEGHDDELIAKLTRRESTKVPWEQLEMQRHAEKMEQERKANQITHKQTTQGPWWSPGITEAFQPADSEMQSMQDRARPPMLGNDISFPRCRSPEPARFDVTQGSIALRNQMCYLTEHAEQESKKASQEPGLWQGIPDPKTQFTSIKTPASSNSSAVNKIQGLWNGFCLDTGDDHPTGGLAPPTQPTGLMTPRYDPSGNPFERSFALPTAGAVNDGPGLTTPPSSQPRIVTPSNLGAIDAVLVSEKELDDVMARDYPDSFITQVYNYLSLGYPSLAKPFDAELSKISRYSIAELRQDDVKAKSQPRGYIRLGPDFEGGGGEGMKEDNCMRWQALKLYIREWARQEKDMVNADGPGGNWGTTARRGSWGL